MMNYSFSSKLLGNPFFYVVILADLVLRGIALYKSARKDQKVWFVALMIINSMGILPIIYFLLNKEIVFTPKVAPKKAARRGKK